LVFSSIDSIVRRDACLWGFLAACIVGLPPEAGAQTATNGTLLISEFRVRGPSGATDEFIEIYNNTDVSHTVTAASGTGYGVAASDGVTRCSIPNGTIIPARGHYLCANSGMYSLGAYATGNATFTTDIPDNAGIAIFNNNTGGGSYSLANRIDAVGSTSEVNTLYKEGGGYPALTPFSIDYSFVRKVPGGCTGAGGGNCGSALLAQTTAGPSTSELQDTNVNVNDFILFVDTNGTSAGAGQRLGAPGPQNLSSPISLDGYALAGAKLDACELRDESPNLVRDFTSDPGNNSTFGTLDVRHTFTNNTGGNITRLRFRILDITTFPSPSGVADLRPRTSPDTVVSVDRAPCGTALSTVLVHGTTLEQPPSQPNGSGFNGSLSAGTVTLGTPLAAGASVDLRFLLGIQQTGVARFCVVPETLPASSSQVFCFLGSTDGQRTKTFSNPAAILVPGTGTSGPAAAYPSNITVAGVATPVTKVTVTLKQASHTFPDDIDILLVGPTGATFVLQSDSTGSADWVGQTYTFDDSAAAAFPDGTAAASGSYRPANYGSGDTFAAPAPAGPYQNPAPVGSSTLAVFNGLNPNGTWSLYITDDVGGDVGTIAGGWELKITTSSGLPGVVTSDFNGNGTSDIAVYRPTTGEWFVQNQAGVSWGVPGDMPVAGDYDGDGITDRAVYRPSTGVWFVQNQAAVTWGAPGDIPVPGDYHGAGSTQRAVFRPSAGTWLVENGAGAVWGQPGDIPVPGDYDGDLTTDFAVYRPSTGAWFVLGLAPVVWGIPGDIPVPGDYDGDGVMDVAVYRPSAGQWLVNGQPAVVWGIPGDMPEPADYNGDGMTDFAVFRPSSGVWLIEGVGAFVWGAAGDLPVPRPDVLGDLNADGSPDVAGYLADFDGNGTDDIAVYRSSAGTWFAQGQAAVVWGALGDIPIPGDYNGGVAAERAVYRPSTGQWIVQGQAAVGWGFPGDIPVPGDYDGNGKHDIAVYRPSTGEWFVQGQPVTQWGLLGDVPVPGDYDGDGTFDIAVYRPSTGAWFVQGLVEVVWGSPGDIPVPGDYDGNGTFDIAVYRPSIGTWLVRNQFAVQWGLAGDVPVPADFNGNGTFDIAVYRPSTGTWFVRNGATVVWGLAGDNPASRAYVPK
jgi:subtilisin-like proprotein convertase family protein